MARVKKEATLEAIRRVGEAMGVDPMKVKLEKEGTIGSTLTVEEELKLIQGEIARLVRPQKSGRAETNGGTPYEVREFPEEDLIEFVEAGWEIVKELRSGRIVLRRRLT